MKRISETKIHTMTQCALFAALLCICSPVALPIGPVPITLSLFAVMLVGVVLDFKKSIVSVGVYILLGMCGLPVFSGARGGVSVLAGPTGGYIWSYLLMAAIISKVSGMKTDNKFIKFSAVFAACIVSIAVCYFFGTLQYMLVQKCELQTALIACVYRFILFDIIKALCASLMGLQIKNALKSAGLM